MKIDICNMQSGFGYLKCVLDVKKSVSQQAALGHNTPVQLPPHLPSRLRWVVCALFGCALFQHLLNIRGDVKTPGLRIGSTITLCVCGCAVGQLVHSSAAKFLCIN
jgi:hypothetical protein